MYVQIELDSNVLDCVGSHVPFGDDRVAARQHHSGAMLDVSGWEMVVVLVNVNECDRCNWTE
jgi:hypothetical protein